MSVPVNKRNVEESPNYERFYAVAQARKLAAHTEHICENPNVFNPLYSRLIDDIVRTAEMSYVFAYYANKIRVGIDATYIRRKSYQDKAITEVEFLIPHIELAKDVFGLKNKKFNYWMGEAIKSRNFLRKWRDEDSIRYAPKYK